MLFAKRSRRCSIKQALYEARLKRYFSCFNYREGASVYGLGPPVASKGTFISHVTYSAPTSSDYQWMYDGAETSNNFTDLYTALDQRGFIQDDKELKKLKAVESRLLKAMEELELSITIFGRDIAYSRWWLDEHVKIVSFTSEIRSDTVFPLFYEELWKINDQTTRSYTIVFRKYEEDVSKNNKVQRWTNISIKVAANKMVQRLTPTTLPK